MPNLTREQIQNLAPDAASLKSGQGLADVRHWTHLGCNEGALWGECRGSAKEPYKVRVDLSDNGSACTCPSRKFPCKHVLGLLLLAAATPGKLSQTPAPDWVADWLEKRIARKEAVAKRADAKTEPESRLKDSARRAAKREKLVQDGIDALEQWLKDIARLGLATVQNTPASFWEEQAARMVDCQLPGAARMIREMHTWQGQYPDWDQALLLRLGRLFLLTQAYRKLDSFPEATQQDVRSLLGWNVNQDELLASDPGLIDDWLVLASRTDEDEKTGLRTQVNWLVGKTSHRPAQIIHFAFRTEPLDASLIPGLVLSGSLVHFPGEYPLRAIFKDKKISAQSFVPAGYPGLAAFLGEYASALGKNPWLETFPVVLENVLPVHSQAGWYVRDAHNQALPFSAQFSSPWELLALSGGYPLTVFCLWDGYSLTPMTAWVKERLVSL